MRLLISILLVLVYIFTPKLVAQSVDQAATTQRAYRVADSLYSKGEIIKALDTLLSVLPMFNEVNNDTLESKILGLFGHLHKNIGNDTLGLRKFMSNLSGAQMEKYMVSVKTMAQYFQNKHNYPKALSYLKKTTIFAQNVNDSVTLAETQLQTGMVFKTMGNLPKSLQYLHKARFVFDKLNNTEGLISTYNELGTIAISLKNEDSAIFYFKQVIDLANNNISINSKIVAYQSLSYLVLKKGSRAEATMYIQKALDLAFEHNKKSIPALLLDMAKIELDKNQKTDALKTLNNCIKQAREQSNYPILIQALTILGQTHKSLGNTRLALKQIEEALLLTNNLQKLQNMEEVARFEARYSLMQKEQEIELLDRERKLREAKLNNEKLRSTIYFVGLILLIILVVVLSYHISSHIRKNKLLSYQNAKINEQNEELNQINQQLSNSENKLMQALSTKNKLFAIMGHDLKSPLMDIKSLIFILKQMPRNLKPADIVSHASTIENRLTTLLELLNNLLNWGMKERNLLTYTPENTDVASIVEKTITIFEGQIQAKQLTIETMLPEQRKWTTDVNMFEFIVRNLLSNAIKFSHANHTIEMTLINTNNALTLTIKDTGIGMNEQEKNKLFIQTSDKIKRGTNNEKGSGLGMSLSYEFIRQMNGTIHVESEQNEGTTIVVQFNMNTTKETKNNNC